ncbi:zf-HC2 domain-containing protein [candidate division KSB1 bacterium]|nr:zf-HC2 domain-containing protein [candidate division KSB1 bacterium]
MRCKDVHKLIYLTESELSQDEKQKLEFHLKECDACRALRDSLAQNIRIIEDMKKNPEIDDATALTNDIMYTIRHIAKFSKKRTNPFDTLLDMFTIKPVRLALAASIVVVFTLFFVQELTVLNRLNHLEQRLAQHGAPSSLTSITGTPKNILSLLDTKQEKVIIDKELLDELLQSYGELQMTNRLLLRTLEEQAEKANITWQDGLTTDEIKSLLESTAIQQKLKNL